MEQLKRQLALRSLNAATSDSFESYSGQTMDFARRRRRRRLRTGNKRLDYAILVAGEVAPIAKDLASAAKSASTAVKNIAGLAKGQQEIKLKKESLAVKQQEVDDLTHRTALWERSLEQSKTKKELLAKQLALKEQELDERDRKNSSSGTIKVKSFTRKDGTKVKASTRRRRKRKSVGKKRK